MELSSDPHEHEEPPPTSVSVSEELASSDERTQIVSVKLMTLFD